DLDCRPEDLVGKRLADVMVYTEEPGMVRHAAEEKGEIRDFEYHFKTLKGADRWVLHSSFVVTDADTGRKVMEATVKDISERKRAEEDLRRHRVKLAELVAEQTRELAHLTHVASHDLQEPLRTVVSFLQLLERRYRGELDETAKEYIDYAVAGAKRMKGLLQDLLAYSGVGTQDLACRDVDLGRVLGEVLSNLRVILEEHEAEVSYGDLPGVWGDEGLLTRLFQNLILDAVRCRSEQKPRVHIEAEREGESWVVTVSDNGVGIDADEKDRVFEIFRRLRDGEESCTGADLAICKRIVERHAGRIWVESRAGEGSRFRFSIPDGKGERT
ncbi:PAS domain S-box protein, partial [bacterium]|nr:PAS domain S-box protein [bacterium]